MAREPIIRAYLVYNTCAGSPEHAPITSANVTSDAPPPDVAKKLRERLAELGFRVERTASFGVRVRAKRSRFEKVFGARIEDGEDLHWLAPPKIPPSLSEFVGEVVFPQSVEVMGGGTTVHP